jgi:hypothetical protein
MKRLRYALLMALLSVFLLGAAPIPFIGAFYTTGKNTVTVEWTAVPNATSYRVRLVYLDKTTIYPYVTVTTNKAVLTRPRTGHFRVDVQAVNSAGTSPWSYSTNSSVALVNSQPMGWQFFWTLPAPTGGVIE